MSDTSGSTSSTKSALHQLLSPDGYYTYLSIPKPNNTTYKTSFSSSTDDKKNDVDTDKIRKNYRRLSLRHHPDRPGGDAESFRVLARAKKVLTSPKLRSQYELLGLDLMDDDETKPDEGTPSKEKKGGKEGGGEEEEEKAESVMSQIASAALATILQVCIRTVMMGAVSVVLSRFMITVAGCLCFLIYISYQIYSVPAGAETVINSKKQYVILGLTGFGVVCMYRGRCSDSFYLFWLGEILAMSTFSYNSIAGATAITTNPPPIVIVGITVACCIISFVLRGRFWRYGLVVGMELGCALITVLVFPVLEMILEELINEKLRKVGDKIRSHAVRMSQLEERSKR